VTGGVLASLLLLLANRQFGMFIHSMIADANMPAFPLVPMMLMLGAMGGVYGIFCSALSLRARHDVR
jgi:hypothetical protein